MNDDRETANGFGAEVDGSDVGLKRPLVGKDEGAWAGVDSVTDFSSSAGLPNEKGDGDGAGAADVDVLGFTAAANGLKAGEDTAGALLIAVLLGNGDAKGFRGEALNGFEGCEGATADWRPDGRLGSGRRFWKGLGVLEADDSVKRSLSSVEKAGSATGAENAFSSSLTKREELLISPVPPGDEGFAFSCSLDLSIKPILAASRMFMPRMTATRLLPPRFDSTVMSE